MIASVLVAAILVLSILAYVVLSPAPVPAKQLDRVEISGDTSPLAVASFRMFAAEAFEATGAALAGVRFAWEVSFGLGGALPTIGSVTTVTATHVGLATISVTGTYQGTTRTASVNVDFVAPPTAKSLDLSAPASVDAGAAFGATVIARNETGAVFPGYRGTVHFTSNDTAATLPADYAFTAADAGRHAFSGLVLRTAGVRSLAVTDTANASLARSVGITVIAFVPEAASIDLTTPSAVDADVPFTASVTVRDQLGAVFTGYLGTIHFASNDTAATLPADYAFTAGDAGHRSFPGIVLQTPGPRSLSVTDTADASLTASVTIVVNSPVRNPDVFTEATFGEPTSLDPAYDYETFGGQVIQNVAETLVWYNGTDADQFKPMLATKVLDLSNPADVAPDGLTWNFTLRSGARFQYGADTVSCNAVKWTFTRILVLNDPQSPAWIYDQSLTNYAVDDPGTPGVNERLVAIDNSISCPAGPTGLAVQFHLAIPYAGFLATLAFTAASILDPNPAAYRTTDLCYFDVNGDGVRNPGEVADLTRSYCHDQLVGTGPFTLRSWQPGVEIVLDRNANYWRTPALFREVHIVQVVDVPTRVQMLLAGDADFISLPTGNRSLVRDGGGNLLPGVQEESGETFNVAFMGLNQDINVAAAPVGDIDVPADFFADVSVRRAFSYAWDYADLIQNALLGYGSSLCGPIPRGMFGYDPSTPCYNYDLTRTQQYLQIASDPRSPTPTDTYWDNGFTLTVYYNIGNTIREEGARRLAMTFQALSTVRGVPGIFNVRAQGLDWPSFLSYVSQRIPSLFFLGWAPDYADPDDYVPSFLHSGYYFPNRLSYSNTTLDALIDQQWQELNVTARTNLLKQIQAASYYDVPYIWMYQGKAYQVMRTWVHGFYENPMTTAGTGNYYYDYWKA